MINLMVKNIFENTNRIDNIARYINKMNYRQCLSTILITASIYTITKVIQKHEEQIKDLEIQLEEMKSKGE